MGSDAVVYVFDYQRYRAELVAAAQQLLLTGELAPWWSETICAGSDEYGMASYADALVASLANCSRIDLARYCTYLDLDLGLNASQSDRARAALRGGQRPTWAERACPSLDCPIRHHCTFHRAQRERQVQVEDFNYALAYAIAARYLGGGQFVGRSRTPFGYQVYLAQLGVDEGDVIHALLERLGRRGFVVGYLFANSDGMQGWLTPTETQAVRSRLDALPLPQYEATFAAMAEQLRRVQGQRAPETHLDTQWEALSLSFVRTVATIAVGVGQGVLWGNDMPTVGGGQSALSPGWGGSR